MSLKKRVFRKFSLFSFIFSLLHGCIISVQSIAPAVLGQPGVIADAVFFVSFVVSALFISAPIVSAIKNVKVSFAIASVLFADLSPVF